MRIARRSLLLAAPFLALAWAGTVLACTPQPVSAESVARVLANSDHVFRGTVVEAADNPTNREAGRVRFTVERVVKGAPTAGEWYGYFKFNRASCGGWTPTVGKRAYFFIYRFEGAVWVTLIWGLDDNEKLMDEAMRVAEKKK